MKVFALLLLLVYTFINCSPERRIEMRNNSNGEAHITWTLKEDSAKTSPLFISNNTQLKFDLKNTSPHNLVKMSYGIGNWTSSMVSDLTNDLESIEIDSGEGQIKLTTETEIRRYLMAHRKGIGKRKIQILFK